MIYSAHTAPYEFHLLHGSDCLPHTVSVLEIGFSRPPAGRRGLFDMPRPCAHVLRRAGRGLFALLDRVSRRGGRGAAAPRRAAGRAGDLPVPRARGRRDAHCAVFCAGRAGERPATAFGAVLHAVALQRRAACAAHWRGRVCARGAAADPSALRHTVPHCRAGRVGGGVGQISLPHFSPPNGLFAQGIPHALPAGTGGNSAARPRAAGRRGRTVGGLRRCTRIFADLSQIPRLLALARAAGGLSVLRGNTKPDRMRQI